MSFALAALLISRTLHPPGGATALIAVIGGPKIHGLGYRCAVVPVGAGAPVPPAVAPAVSNLAPGRQYPDYWC